MKFYAVAYFPHKNGRRFVKWFLDGEKATDFCAACGVSARLTVYSGSKEALDEIKDCVSGNETWTLDE